jgi:NAD(P)H-dependent flavin oxidoreductase YrpB (nitropropane dioxygenase family)
MTALDDLGLGVPLLAAPMAGGPSTPALVAAAAAAGALGLLAGGYRTAEQLGEQIAEVRRSGSAFGVNLFVPNPVPVDPSAYRRYAAVVRAEAARYDVDVPDGDPLEDDDHWADKLALLLDDPVPVVSFTFNLPERAAVDALRAAGTLVIQTVTSVPEALAAVDVGADVLAVQSSAAGGHSGTFTPATLPAAVPLQQLLEQTRAVVRLPLVAAGGIATAGDVAGVLGAGAAAAAVGTVLLRSEESAASQPFKDALADPARTDTVVTRAFTGRPARALRNAFVDAHDGEAIEGYPAVHHLTSPMRRAAAAAGDAERINLWAGTGFRAATTESATAILRRLAGA